MRFLICAALMLAVVVAPTAPNIAAPTLKNENLLVGIPNGYKTAYQTRKGNMKMIEMIPRNEHLKNWSEMVTVQIFLNNHKLKPMIFYKAMSKLFAKSCRGSTAHLIKKGRENGYDFSFFYIHCHLNSTTGKAEYVWFKSIRGKDSFYVVQKAWRKTPKKSGIIKWSKYLRRIAVCDTRTTNHKCP